mmetsp:Transcript_11887/g.27507  ORF Transcript_11887/g.27507 Transcript_11887/m.27507 type:complete len:404 (+) Transcript_11887:192-1403(+)
MLQRPSPRTSCCQTTIPQQNPVLPTFNDQGATAPLQRGGGHSHGATLSPPDPRSSPIHSHAARRSHRPSRHARDAARGRPLRALTLGELLRRQRLPARRAEAACAVEARPLRVARRLVARPLDGCLRPVRHERVAAHDGAAVRRSDAAGEVLARQRERLRLVRVEEEAAQDRQHVRAGDLQQRRVLRLHLQRVGVDLARLAAIGGRTLGRELEAVVNQQRRLAVGLRPLRAARVASLAEGLGEAAQDAERLSHRLELSRAPLGALRHSDERLADGRKPGRLATAGKVGDDVVGPHGVPPCSGNHLPIVAVGGAAESGEHVGGRLDDSARTAVLPEVVPLARAIAWVEDEDQAVLRPFDAAAVGGGHGAPVHVQNRPDLALETTGGGAPRGHQWRLRDATVGGL